jgi:hypothetical protein
MRATCTCILACILTIPCVAAAKPKGKPKKKPAASQADLAPFHYVAQWRGYRKGSSAFGKGTAVLIAPNWALTAAHVANRMVKAPSTVNAALLFKTPGKGELQKVGVKKAYGGLLGDMALLELVRPLKGITPAALLASPINKSDDTIAFTMAAGEGGLHVHRNRRGRSKDGKGFYHSADAGGNRPGKAGDSGGAWVVERGKGQPHVLFAIIHGGGKGAQVAPNIKKIAAIMKKASTKPVVVPKRHIQKHYKPNKPK